MARVLLSVKCLLLIAICNSCTKDSLDNGDLYLFFEYETSEYATIIDGEKFFFLTVCCPSYTFDNEKKELYREEPDDFDLNRLKATMGGKYNSRGGAGVVPGGDASLLHDFYSIPTREVGGLSVTQLELGGTIHLTYNGPNPIDSVMVLHAGEEWTNSVSDTVSYDYYDNGQKTTIAEVTTTYKIINHGMLKKSDIVIY